MTWSIGVDVGGTFTDFFAYDHETSVGRTFKRPSTPANPAEAILDGLSDLAAEVELPLAEVNRLAHGTTVATNALIERRGARVALLTTAGFRDLLEIGRQTRPRMFDLQADRIPPLVPRELRLEVTERMDAEGRVVTALDDASLGAAVAAAREAGVEACAVVFLFGFLNPEHENRAAARLRQEMPDLFVSQGSVVQPEFREFERSSTTVLNAYLQPVVARYVDRLAAGLGNLVPGAELGINQSSGGLMSPGRAQEFPIRTALSGPAAGVVGAAHAARRSGVPDLITLDMGGTSADVCLIRDFAPGMSFEREVGGFPVRQPTVDVHTVGAGGGSLAWFDRDGLLKVGPASAGADPGPACYGRGGDRPTVSDANLVLGRLSAEGLLGGRMALDAEAAEAAIDTLAEPLGYSRTRTAHGILGIVAANMVRAIRTITVERGHDPREFTLMPFGGAGALHASDVARALGMRRILVPAAPGILCARGLIVADLKEDFVYSERIPLGGDIGPLLDERLAVLQQRAESWFDGESVPPKRRQVLVSADMRYVGQNFELNVSLGEAQGRERAELPGAQGLVRRFFDVHESVYGFHDPEGAVELMNLRLTARGRLHPEPQQADLPRREYVPEAYATRNVYFAPEQGLAAELHRRSELEAGARIDGPAVVEEFDATTVLAPGDRARVDGAGNLLVEVTS